MRSEAAPLAPLCVCRVMEWAKGWDSDLSCLDVCCSLRAEELLVKGINSTIGSGNQAVIISGKGGNLCSASCS